MEVHQLDGHDHGLGHGVVELDICFACQGIWFDHRENLKLSPQAVVELFTLLHQHRTDERRPCSASWPACAACDRWRSRSTWCAAAATWCTAARSSTGASARFRLSWSKRAFAPPHARGGG